MGNLLLVCVGGGAGSGARWLLATWTNERFGSAFAWGTLAVNVLGSFALAFLVQLASTSASFSPQLRLGSRQSGGELVLRRLTELLAHLRSHGGRLRLGDIDAAERNWLRLTQLEAASRECECQNQERGAPRPPH